ncbi:DUF1254 domain-containing protein [Variovorax sp. dw_954]|uniref:DUF1254 domain-containing protein n=1 Tax=Variovorax sp. dw_954 TaxID=2720078 RepID=UPI001BD513E5|nr:DUF1254 domain-containing protein [Variovorax sp. dw_954]
MPPKSNAQQDHAWFENTRVKTRFGEFSFKNGFPDSDSADRLAQMMTFNRAVEIYQHHLAAVSMFQFRRGLAEFGAQSSHQVVVWESLLDAHTLLLTGNSETVYLIGFLDLKQDGPTVVEAPAGMLGVLDDMWMRFVGDVGPTGQDKGQGGKYLVLPPGYDGEVPSDHFVLRSPTFGVWMLLRAIDPKPADAAARSKRLRVYPLARASNPPPMQFLDGSGQAIDTIAPDDYRFFEQLGALVEQEPPDAVLPMERFYLTQIGMQFGQPFEPDAKLRELLSEAAVVGQAAARANGFAYRAPGALIYESRQWQWAFVGGSYTFSPLGYPNPDLRSGFAYSATGNTPAMAMKIVGAGSQYIWTCRDATGDYLDGARRYRLRIPAGVPVKDFWSVVVYDAASRSMLQNGQAFPTVSQYTGPEVNADGSVDIDFGPEAPAGREKNWIRTLEGKGWFPILRFYGPTEAFFDKTWIPADIERQA